MVMIEAEALFRKEALQTMHFKSHQLRHAQHAFVKEGGQGTPGLTCLVHRVPPLRVVHRVPN